MVDGWVGRFKLFAKGIVVHYKLTHSFHALFLCVMKKYSIMQAQHNLASVLREVEAGYEVGITRRKKLVARLLPPEQPEKVQFPDFGERARSIWGGATQGTSSDDLLNETRGDW